jgi:putative flippase GtrA
VQSGSTPLVIIDSLIDGFYRSSQVAHGHKTANAITMPSMSNYMRKLFVYAAIGILNTGTDFLVFLIITEELDYHPLPANVISYSVGIVLSFIMNRRFTFRASTYNLDLRHQFVRFGVINLLSLAISTTLVILFSKLMTPPLAKIASVPFVLLWGFLAVRAFVFASPALAGRNRRILFQFSRGNIRERARNWCKNRSK